MTRRRLGSVIARDPAGNELLLLVYAHEVISHAEDGSVIHDVVRRELVTEDGRPVTANPDGTFVIDGAGTTLTSNDPLRKKFLGK